MSIEGVVVSILISDDRSVDEISFGADVPRGTPLFALVKH